MDVQIQMKELQCSTFRRNVMVIKVSFRRGILMLIYFSILVGSCSARLLLLSDPAIQSPLAIGLLLAAAERGGSDGRKLGSNTEGKRRAHRKNEGNVKRMWSCGTRLEKKEEKGERCRQVPVLVSLR